MVGDVQTCTILKKTIYKLYLMRYATEKVGKKSGMVEVLIMLQSKAFNWVDHRYLAAIPIEFCCGPVYWGQFAAMCNDTSFGVKMNCNV